MSQHNPIRSYLLINRRDNNGAGLSLIVALTIDSIRVRQFVARHSSIPFLFGTLDGILKGSGSAIPEGKGLAGRFGFMKENPGRQMIGSFYPLHEQGWAEAAYEVMDHLSDSEEFSSGSEETEYRGSEEQESEEPENREARDSGVVEHSNNTNVHSREQ